MAMKTLLMATAIISLGLSGASYAQMQHSQDHGAHAPAATTANEAPSNEAFRAANAKMHKDMDIPLSGNADVDFVRGMIPHHQGAIDMAKIVLTYGKDEATRKLATDIIKAQEEEIAMMNAWLLKNAK